VENEEVGRGDATALAEIGRGHDFGCGKVGREWLHRLVGAQFIRNSSKPLRLGGGNKFLSFTLR
jgi:hypothetical protein